MLRSLRLSIGLALGLAIALAAPSAFAQCNPAQAPSAGFPCVSQTWQNTYGLGVPQFTPAATPTDVVVVSGSAAKIVRVLRVAVSCLATTAGSIDVSLTMHTVANTGGTATAPVLTALDSFNPAATATVAQYSANPTISGTPPVVRDRIVSCALTGATQPATDFVSTIDNDQPIVLHGVAQQLAINLGGQTLPTGMKLSYEIETAEQ